MCSNTFRRAALCAASAMLVCSIAFAQSAPSLAKTNAPGGPNLNPQIVVTFTNDWNPLFLMPLGIAAGPDEVEVGRGH